MGMRRAPWLATVVVGSDPLRYTHMMNASRLVGKTLMMAAGVVAAVGVMSGSANAQPLPDFTINQNTVSNCATFANPVLPCSFVADKMVGNYNEVFTATGATTFSTVAYWDLGQFVSNDGTNPLITPFLNNGLNGPAPLVPDGYRVYGLFSANGTFVPNGLGGFDFTGLTGGIDVFVDLAQDGSPKVLPTSAPGAVTVPGTADALLASAALASSPCPFGLSCGRTTNTSASGDFNLTFQPFNLTGLGSSYFVQPVPFYMTVILKGQFNSFNPTPAGCTPGLTPVACSQTINGSADAFFNTPAVIPEPATLTLVGLGLLGAARRRFRKS